MAVVDDAARRARLDDVFEPVEGVGPVPIEVATHLAERREVGVVDPAAPIDFDLHEPSSAQLAEVLAGGGLGGVDQRSEFADGPRPLRQVFEQHPPTGVRERRKGFIAHADI